MIRHRTSARRSGGDWPDRDWGLHNWSNQDQRPIRHAGSETVIGKVLDAIRNKHRIHIRYHGGSTPGATRWIHPERVYRNASGTYVVGYCEKSQSSRTFDADKVVVLSSEPIPEKPKPEPTMVYTATPASNSLVDILFGYLAIFVIYVVPALVLFVLLSSLF